MLLLVRSSLFLETGVVWRFLLVRGVLVVPRAKKKPPAEMPEHLAALIALFEAQEEPARQAAIRQVEKEHEVEINLDEACAEFPDFAERYQRWWSRLTMGLEDAAVGSAMKGKGSATTILRGIGALNGIRDSRGKLLRGNGSGRLQLDRPHEARAASLRKW